LGIFPEGRIQMPTLRPALPGAAFLALRTGAPILPVGIFTDNEWDIFGTLGREKRRLRVTCRIGEVFGPLEVENRKRPSREAIDQAGEEIMFAIAALLPPSMRGAYD
jgi:1-acyl-sn-glycerol-3-phosphate acyltransferase